MSRYIWPVGSEQIIYSELEGPGHLNPTGEIFPDGFEDDAENADWRDARSIANLMCPHMDSLEPFDSAVHNPRIWLKMLRLSCLFLQNSKAVRRPTSGSSKPLHNKVQ
jgi:hypothetical protein